jgi:hypothetical protein
MAVTTIRTSYALTADTVARLEALALRWQVSKSEALRRAINQASAHQLSAEPPLNPADALTRLRQTATLTKEEADRWSREVRQQRRQSRSGKPA